MPAKYERRQGATTQWLLGLIEEFLTINNIENDGNYFGWALCKDRTLVQRLREEGDITITRMDDALAFMQNPVGYTRVMTSEGWVKVPLKPLTIKTKELP